MATKEAINEADLQELNTKLGELKKHAGGITVAIAIAVSRIGVRYPEVIDLLNYPNVKKCLTRTVLDNLKRSSTHPSVVRARDIAILALAERPGIYTIDNPQPDNRPEPPSVS